MKSNARARKKSNKFKGKKPPLPGPAGYDNASTKVEAGNPPNTPERGEELMAIMSQGYSLTAAAGYMGLSRDTFHEWKKRYPEFADAIERGMAMRVFKLESDLLAAQDAATVKSCIFALKNAAPEEWRDKREVEPEVKPGGEIAQLFREIAGSSLKPVALIPGERVDDLGAADLDALDAEYTEARRKEAGQ